jgi:hypothetical protein
MTSGSTILQRLDAFILQNPFLACRQRPTLGIRPALTRPIVASIAPAGNRADSFWRALSCYKSVRSRQFCVGRTALGTPNQRLARAARLSRRLDHVAIGAPRHDAVLQLAGGGQVARKPDPDGKQDDSDDKAGNSAAPIVALVGIRFGHGRSLLAHAPEKCVAVFPRDKRGTRLREDHAQIINQSEAGASIRTVLTRAIRASYPVGVVHLITDAAMKRRLDAAHARVQVVMKIALRHCQSAPRAGFDTVLGYAKAIEPSTAAQANTATINTDALGVRHVIVRPSGSSNRHGRAEAKKRL